MFKLAIKVFANSVPEKVVHDCGADGHDVLDVVVDMAQTLVMENGWKGEFTYGASPFVYEELNQELVCS